MPINKKIQAKTPKRAQPKKTAVKKKLNTDFKPIANVLGILMILLSVLLFLAFASYFAVGGTDQSQIAQESVVEVSNWLGYWGACIADFFVYEGVGFTSFLMLIPFFLIGLRCFDKVASRTIVVNAIWTTLAMVWLPMTFAFLPDAYLLYAGGLGMVLHDYMVGYIGSLGLAITLFFGYLIYLLLRFKIHPAFLFRWCKPLVLKILDLFASLKQLFNKQQDDDMNDETRLSEEAITDNEQKEPQSLDTPVDLVEQKTTEGERIAEESMAEAAQEKTASDLEHVADLKPTVGSYYENSSHNEEEKSDAADSDDLELDVEAVVEEKKVKENTAQKLMENFGLFDPTLDLSTYQLPSLQLLKSYDEKIVTDEAELEQHKQEILDTLLNYKISVQKIKACVGPTVTLYEIIPEKGVRVAKIKNLEDDLAMSLSALGIRIIAPIPGAGTIGIEVPNKKPTIVSMFSVLSSQKFQNSKMELPIALGKTITNQTFVVDLVKMPHLLMAGATGQGKSVGLNAILTSILYRKHPAEVKFVLVDPKKVELTLFNKIERHFLAKLPDDSDAIITDTSVVVNTLNSLCTEMDNRYELLKTAMVRNIKEYNERFKKRQLNPENGHRFLPYIVLVIDEFADLIMTAGKEVEIPIARLAQLARAIGIHLIVATQRPSVNVITGIIKANFPARIAFRVTTKTDSRTILDTSGADQLIGRGDMLYSGGNDIVRLQCAFVDTPEVEEIVDFIGNQKAYSSAYLLPEYLPEGAEEVGDSEISERDALFKEAAAVVVLAQQGSASLLQRKLKLGYNRAGRIIDQLEAAGIVGPFEGSKARSVLFQDTASLEAFLAEEEGK